MPNALQTEETLGTAHLKFLDRNGRGPCSGWQWPVGKWVEVDGDLEICRNGLHVTTVENAVRWLDARCHPVEIRGDQIAEQDKVCVRAAKLGPAFDTWNERMCQLFVADCAEHVLHIFERERPDDSRPRDAIQAARQFAHGEIDAAAAAWAADAAWAAAGAADAAWAADAARAAVRAAVRAAARAADAAWAAEHKWQGERLIAYLTGAVEGGAS